MWNTHTPILYMKYLEFTFTTAPGGEAVQDVLSAVLAEIGFDSFVHTGSLDLPRQARTDDPEAPILPNRRPTTAIKPTSSRTSMTRRP